MLEKIEKMTPEETIFGKEKGKDFIFIFDLLAHTSGVESTLRVLSHADENFRRICQPRIQPLDGQYIQVSILILLSICSEANLIVPDFTILRRAVHVIISFYGPIHDSLLSLYMPKRRIGCQKIDNDRKEKR